MTPTLKRILRTLGTVLGWILLLLLIGVPLSFLLFLALLWFRPAKRAAEQG